MTGHEVGAALGVAVLSAIATTAGDLTNEVPPHRLGAAPRVDRCRVGSRSRGASGMRWRVRR